MPSPSWSIPPAPTVATRATLAAALLALAAACETPASSPGGEPAVPPAAAPEAPPAAEPEATSSALDPQALYAQCRERVEGPEADGECSADADCVKGGCSGEVCATPKSLEGMMGTCEVLPCFEVLQACGCNDGRCTWTVGPAAAGSGAPPVVLPPRDALSAPAAPVED